MGHYRELFSRPGNDSEMFYAQGHKMRKMNPKKSGRHPNKRGVPERPQLAANELMESEQFHVIRSKTASPKKKTAGEWGNRRAESGSVTVSQ